MTALYRAVRDSPLDILDERGCRALPGFDASDLEVVFASDLSEVLRQRAGVALALRHERDPVVVGFVFEPNDEKDELDIGSGSLVSATGPGHPCLECTGHWFHGDEEEGVIHDREPDAARGAGYVQGREDGEELPDDGEGDERAPSVATNNGLVASLLALRFQALAVGITSQALVGSQEYDALFGTVGWQEDSNNEKRISCKEDCTRKEALARGDHYELPTEPDPTFRKVLEEHREGDQQRETVEPVDGEQTERGVFQRITTYAARLVNRSSKEPSQ